VPATDWKDGKYSWVTPRFQGKPMQVGPTAAVLVGVASKHEPTLRWATTLLDITGGLLKASGNKAELSPTIVESTLGRHAARAIRCAVMAEAALKNWGLLVENIGKGDFSIFNAPTFPKGEQRGFGFHEAPRGTLSHWVVIRDGKIHNYQAVVPSTWNAGARQRRADGPLRGVVVGNPIADPGAARGPAHGAFVRPILACAVTPWTGLDRPVKVLGLKGARWAPCASWR
jgi:hydrogenase large subunit